MFQVVGTSPSQDHHRDEWHTKFVVFYRLLNDDHLQYRELGGNYFDILDPTRLQRCLVKRLESLGYEVTLAERKAA